VTRANERILKRKEEETAELAEATFRALGDVLSASKHALPVEDLFQMHAGNKARLLELFQKSSGLCGMVRFAFDRWTSMVSGPDDMKDTTLLSDQANLFSSLLAEYPSAFPGEQAESVRQELRKLIHEAVRLCVASVSPQADRLKDVIQGVVDYQHRNEPTIRRRHRLAPFHHRRHQHPQSRHRIYCHRHLLRNRWLLRRRPL